AIPLAIANPQLSVSMVEAKVRKSAFLREAVRTLGLRAQVWTSRFEALLSDPGMHEFADILSLRAVRVDVRTLASIQAFVKPGGRFFLFRPTGNVGDITTPPTIGFSEAVPLVESLRSQLIILEKRRVGRASSVSRGTSST
ncbi:MAG TPA: RsmG family class I SAM-dependent methyltransferase, partial [Vicinamibacterales bacterium]